ncbi:MAG: BamA/TamA family outer membrane protein [Salinivirgaceae bacterium]
MINSHYFKNIPYLWPALFLFYLGISNSFAQNNRLSVTIKCQDYDFNKFPNQFASKEDLLFKLNEVKQCHINKGYLAFSIDSIIFDSTKAAIFATRGNRYLLNQWNCLPETYNHLLPKLRKPTPYIYKTLTKAEDKILTELYSEGFATALIKKELVTESTAISVTYQIQKGERFTFDTIHVLGPKLISANYIQHKTGIFPNKPYQSKKVKNSSFLINQSGFLKVDSVALSFVGTKAQLQLSMKAIQQNSFSGILGVQTNQKNETEITGTVELQLVNSLKMGEKMYLNWKKPAPASQDLQVNFQFPYLFKSPVGIVSSALFEKQDSSFSNTAITAGISIPILNSGELGLLSQWKSTSIAQKGVSIYGTSESHLYGLSYNFQTFSPMQLSTKGIGIVIYTLAGTKKNISTDTENYQSFSAEIQETLEWMIPAPLGALYFKNQAGLLSNDSLYSNNLFRSGGFNSIRGFNEKSIYSKTFTYFTGAYRIILKSASYMELFYDLGWFNEPTTTNFTAIKRQALGMGINIKTKAGIASIAFAIGKKDRDPFALNEGKIHLGFTSLF